MKFEWHRMHKLDEWVEREVTEAVEERICDFFEIEDTNEMTQEQYEAVWKFREEEVNEYSPLQWGFSNVLNAWENYQYELEQENETSSD